MSWITPKTNWTTNDYYNLEDAQRIAGNICYLKEMALDIYPSGAITCLIERKRAGSTSSYPIYYGMLSVNVENLTVVTPEAYTHDLTFWLDKDATNFYTLMMLLLLSSQSEVKSVSGKAVDYSISSPNINYPFTGDCIYNHNRAGSFDFSNPLKSIVEGTGMTTYPYNLPEILPLYSAWNNNSGKCQASIYTYTNNLMNEKFWTNYNLIAIESVIYWVHYYFDQYIGG